MDITGASEHRFALGVECFLQGQSLVCDGVVFSRDAERSLRVQTYSEWQPENVTLEHAKARITHARVVLASLLSASPAFRSAVEDLLLEFQFCHDYGTGSILLATEIGERFEWRQSATP